MPTQTMTQEERAARVSTLLHQVDEDVKAHKLDNALDHIRKVYEFDIKNAYARAYEERILIMMMEKERAAVMLEAEKKAAEQIDKEVKRRLNEFYQKQELETQKRKQVEKTEQVLEDRARKASVDEVQEVVHTDINNIEKETIRRIEELEKKLITQIQQTVPQAPAGTTVESTEQIRKEYEAKVEQYKKQFEATKIERKKIEEEAFLKMKEEQKHLQDELMRKMEEERNVMQEREREKAKKQGVTAYQSLMKLMMQLAVPAEIQSSLLHSLKISFSISDEEHTEMERVVQVSAYIDAVRALWQNGKPTEEDFVHLKNLQSFFKISEDEHISITKGVKKDLVIPDETAVIIVIDDDLSIRKYVEHILKKTYLTVHTVESAENALPIIEKTIPSLIISDINLGAGVMSGFTFYEKISSGTYGEKIKSIPFILMSSLQDEFFVKSAKQLGVKAYVPKPFTRESLEAVVKTVLG